MVLHKDVEYGASRQEEKRKPIEKAHGRGGGGHARAGVTEEDAEDRVRWRQMIGQVFHYRDYCGD